MPRVRSVYRKNDVQQGTTQGGLTGYALRDAAGYDEAGPAGG